MKYTGKHRKTLATKPAQTVAYHYLRMKGQDQ